MKTYKSWEAMKMLTENRNLKFINNSDEMLKRFRDIPKVTNFAQDVEFLLYFDTDWTLVQKPVTFMEAINSGKRMKLARCTKFETVSSILQIITLMLPEKQLDVMNGNWFLEDGEIDE